MSGHPYIAGTMLPHPSASRLFLALLLVPAGCQAQEPARAATPGCTVSRVSDGDSFRCSDGRRVRLIGIDTPELQQRPFGPRARTALLGLVPVGATVRLERDAAPVDRYSRELA